MALAQKLPKTVTIATQVADRLTPILGSFNAEVWVKVVAKRDLDLAPEQILPPHLPKILEGLRPSLNTFVGRAAAAELIAKIAREVR